MTDVIICSKLLENIYSEKVIKGYIHSVFNKSCNILTNNNKLISILSEKNSMAPMSVLIKEPINFKSLKIKQGMKIIITNDIFAISKIECIIDLTRKNIWNPIPSFDYIKTSEENIKNKLKVMEEYIFKYGKHEGISPLLLKIGEYYDELKLFARYQINQNLYSNFILDYFLEFLNSIIVQDYKKVQIVSKKLAGFGPGLTPSTDDFISGLMISLIYFAEYFMLDILKVYELNFKILQGVEKRTTTISYKFLQFASKGEATDDVKKLMVSLLSQQNNTELKENVRKIIQFGNTSGTDTLCGLYLGARILINSKFRRSFQN